MRTMHARTTTQGVRDSMQASNLAQVGEGTRRPGRRVLLPDDGSVYDGDSRMGVTLADIMEREPDAVWDFLRCYGIGVDFRETGVGVDFRNNGIEVNDGS